MRLKTRTYQYEDGTESETMVTLTDLREWLLKNELSEAFVKFEMDQGINPGKRFSELLHEKLDQDGLLRDTDEQNNKKEI